ncbi:MAG TPA: aspartate aminotransferase family protein [Candidatus Saccharimonadales bacterium]|nr:aspartate aminotransferase family protein [Candidatus Saccharimonadales bacterium]
MPVTELSERASAALCDTYARVPLNLVRGEGAWVISDRGDRLLDCVSGIGVNVLGHGHPAVLDALTNQAKDLIHASNLYLTEPQVLLAERLVAGAFPSRVFFANSGAEVNEAAIKVARKWGRLHKGGAHVIVTLTEAFHGRTLGSLAATGSAKYSRFFQPLPLGFRQVPRGDLGALEAALDDEVAAVMLEPIQGESGVFPISDTDLVAIREMCDRHCCLLAVDEIQSGMGRTGRLWAHQWAGIVPDVMTVAKGLAGGMAIGAMLVGPRADVFEPGDHGSTFGGSPLACAVGVAVLETIQREGLIENANRIGEQLRAGILELGSSGLPILGVRGRGLMLGVALRRPISRAAAAACLEAGLLVNSIGQRTLRMLPPLILSAGEADLAIERLGAGLATSVYPGPSRGPEALQVGGAE